MAIALVTGAHASAGGANGGTTGSIDTTGANLLIAALCAETGSGETLTDNKGNTWAQLTIRTSVHPEIAIWYMKNPAVGTGHTFTCSTASSFSSFCVAAFSGADTSSPFDQQNGVSSGNSPQSTGSITPGSNNELVVSCVTFNLNSAVSVTASMTITDTFNFAGGTNYGSSLAYIVQTTAAAINPQWTFTADTSNAAVAIASFKAAGAAAQTPYQPWQQRAPILAQ